MRDRTIAITVLLLVAVAGCDLQATEPCAGSVEKPVLHIAAARDAATGVPLTSLFLSRITRDGLPVDTSVLRTDLRWNVERRGAGLVCGVPCAFGRAAGDWAFDAHATGYYSTAVQVVAAYSAIPAGCPASHGTPASVVMTLTEADSARVTFTFVASRATGLASDIAAVTFDDGSGPRTIDLAAPWPTFETRNTGTMHVRIVIGAPDTMAAGVVALPLRKDWAWSVGAYLQERNPVEDSFCVQATSFPLRRAVPGADSLYIAWGGLPLSVRVAC